MSRHDSAVHRHMYNHLFGHDVDRIVTRTEYSFLMYQPLEKHRLYLIGIGDEARELVYIGRDFHEDGPVMFEFVSTDGIVIQFTLPQLTEIEKQGGIRAGDKVSIPTPRGD